jgi:hypothetical protein
VARAVWVVVSVSIAAALIIAPIIWLSGGTGGDVAGTGSEPASTSEPTVGAVDDVLVIAGEEFPVGDLVEAFAEQDMYLPVVGVAPAFDTSPWGEEMPLVVADPRVNDDDIIDGPSVYLGDLGTKSVFLTEEDFTDPDSEASGMDPHKFVWIGDTGIGADLGVLTTGRGSTAVWIGVPDGTAIVAVTTDAGPIGWQVPHSRVVVMPVPLEAIGFIALDANGNELLRWDGFRPDTETDDGEPHPVTTTTP